MNRRTKRKLQRIIWTAWEYLKLAAVGEYPKVCVNLQTDVR